MDSILQTFRTEQIKRMKKKITTKSVQAQRLNEALAKAERDYIAGATSEFDHSDSCEHEYYPVPPKGKRWLITKEKCIKCGRTRNV